MSFFVDTMHNSNLTGQQINENCHYVGSLRKSLAMVDFTTPSEGESLERSNPWAGPVVERGAGAGADPDLLIWNRVQVHINRTLSL